MIHNALCCSKSLNWCPVRWCGLRYQDVDFSDRVSWFRHRTKRAWTAMWHDSCGGRTLDGGNYTLKRSWAYITDHNQEMKKWGNHSGAQIQGKKRKEVIIWSPFVTSVWLDEFSREPVFIIKAKPTQTVTLLKCTGPMIRVFSSGSPMLPLRLQSPWSPAEAGCDVTT